MLSKYHCSADGTVRHSSSSSPSSSVAVVIVFTVCQIPQAISLSLQSFLPVLARSSKVLIYNNFANSFVALNASINFLLYCCFSDRFRATFRANFAFLSKYCARFIRPECSLKPGRRRPTHSTSFDDVSNSYTMINQSNYSLPVNRMNRALSNVSNETNGRCSTHFPRQQQSITIEGDKQQWIYRLPLLSNFASQTSRRSGRITFQTARPSHSSDSVSSSISLH